MQSLLNRSVIMLLMLITCSAVNAQVKLKKPDVIQKMDKTSLEVVIDEINKTEILYRKASDPKGPIYALPKRDVSKIIWNNGDVEEITAAPVPVAKNAKPTALPVKAEKAKILFWDQGGLFAGVRAGAGIGMVASPHADVLASGSKLAYNLGGTIGYRVKSVSVQLDALYTGLSYGMNVPNSLNGVKSIAGTQASLFVPLTATIYTRISKTKVGLTIGGFGNMQVGAGGTKVTYENTSTNVKNCADCTDKLSFGVVGGVTATLIERPTHAIFLDARWYQNLSNNSDYKIAESGVKMNTAVISAGVLFNLAH